MIQCHLRILFLSLPVSHHAEKNWKHDVSPTICALFSAGARKSTSPQTQLLHSKGKWDSAQMTISLIKIYISVQNIIIQGLEEIFRTRGLFLTSVLQQGEPDPRCVYFFPLTTKLWPALLYMFTRHMYPFGQLNPFFFAYLQADTSVSSLIFAFMHLVMTILHWLKNTPLFHVYNTFQILKKLQHPANSTAE